MMVSLHLASLLSMGLLAAVALVLLCAVLDSSFENTAPSVSTNGGLSLLLQQQRLPLRRIPPVGIPPVQVLVCVEALCIDSQRFFHDQLMIAFNALGHDVMNLTVVPFGNAKLPSDDSSREISCQHGFGECDTNAYEQCAIHLYPDPAQHVPYLGCLFAALPMGHRDAPFEQWIGLEPCAREHHLDFEKVKQCHNDADLVWQLQQDAAKATPTRHDHVPWTEVNGIYMDEESNTLLQEVCKVYHQAGGHTAGCSASE